MSSSLRLRSLAALLGAVGLAAMASAATFAPEGAKGILEMEIRVEGKGRVDECGTCAYYDWSALHQATLRVPVTAMEPGLDAGQLAGLGGDPADEPEDGAEEEDWEAKWDDKLDACDGDEACEMRVTMQKMQDPRFQGSIGAVMQGMAMMEAGELDLGLAVQRWVMAGGAVTGKVEIGQQLDTYGMLDTGGGPPVDSHCRTQGSENLQARLTGYGDMHPILSVNAKESTYELHLPADHWIAVTDDCSPGRQGNESLLGIPRVGANWAEVLKVSGRLAGSPRQPRLDGTSVWQADLQSATGVRPLRVTIQWKFRPDAAG